MVHNLTKSYNRRYYRKMLLLKWRTETQKFNLDIAAYLLKAALWVDHEFVYRCFKDYADRNYYREY